MKRRQRLAFARAAFEGWSIRPGSWHRLDLEWFICAERGSDANDGLSTKTPLKTLAELQRRFGRQGP